MILNTSISSGTSASVRLNLLIYKLFSFFECAGFVDFCAIEALIGDDSGPNKRVYYDLSSPPAP